MPLLYARNMATDDGDDLFFERFGNRFFDVYAFQFSVDDLGHIFHADTMLKLNNWIQAGYIKPNFWKDPRGGKERRRFSITEIARIAVIDALVNSVGIKPNEAIEVADFCIPFLNESLERDATGKLKSTANMYVMSWRDRATGKTQSSVYYRKPNDPNLYTDNPDLNPDAAPAGPPAGIAIHLPLSDFFNKVFIECAKFLAMRKRGVVDRVGRPVNAASRE
jgi:hypothetical protein